MSDATVMLVMGGSTVQVPTWDSSTAQPDTVGSPHESTSTACCPAPTLEQPTSAAAVNAMTGMNFFFTETCLSVGWRRA